MAGGRKLTGKSARTPTRAGRRTQFVLLAARFNEPITRRLVEGAMQTLARRGVPRTQIRTLWVPGTFELSVAAAWAAKALRPQAMVALGCLIKGQTPQYAAIGQAVAEGLTQVSVQSQIPVGFGVIIADSFSQAQARVGGAVGHRGREAALAAFDMVTFKEHLQNQNHRPH